MMASNHYGTISDADNKGRFSYKQRDMNKIGSEGYFDGNAKPPRLTKKTRPYSAPRG
jgi:hypothetical protein